MEYLLSRNLTSVRSSRCFHNGLPRRLPRRHFFHHPIQQKLKPIPSIRKKIDVGTGPSGGFLNELEEALSSKEHLRVLLELGRSLPDFPIEFQTIQNRVMGCTTKTYLRTELNGDRVQFCGTSDSELTKGFIHILMKTLSSPSVEEVLKFDPMRLKVVLGLGNSAVLAPSRSNGFLNLVETLKRQTRFLQKEFPRFPSLIIRSTSLEAVGAFAEAQAKFLQPDMESVKDLAGQLSCKKVGVVAHFYMDPEVQGLLTGAKEFWPHIHISDSILMSEMAVQMSEEGCEHIAVLGVDFMSENVRSVMDKAGYSHIPVYRMSTDLIGCSLAEAAASSQYEQYLRGLVGGNQNPALHVIYINTSLQTKAISQSIVPTITCTSGNVIQTLLQSFAQVEELRVLYGPDTYMGKNIHEMFKFMSNLSDKEISTLHPGHNQSTVRSLLDRFHYFEEGTCIVHHLFGGEVCQIVREAYGDAYITAHFEVPGEMFALAMEARQRGMGVIGSTSNILNFIKKTVEDQAEERTADRLEFVLGTESGMITSIVRAVQGILSEKEALEDLEVEIVFPVSPSAITIESQQTDLKIALPEELAVVPGVAAGEGCSAEGGCANCPYMKMNTLTSLKHIVEKIGQDESHLEGYYPESYHTHMKIGNEVKFVHDLGTQPILEMRHFQKHGVLSDALIQSIHTQQSISK